MKKKSEKTPSEKSSTKKTPKSKNSSNKKRANVGLSIERLCEQIAHSNEEIAKSEMRNAGGDGTVSQMLAMQFFQGQLQGQDRKIENIERQSRKISLFS